MLTEHAGYVLLRMLEDVVLYGFFMHRPLRAFGFSLASARRIVCVVGIAVLCAAVDAAFAYAEVLPQGIYGDVSATFCRFVLAFFLGRLILGLPVSTALYQGLLYTVLFRIGYTLYNDVAVPVCCALQPSLVPLMTALATRTVVVALLCILLLVLFSPREGEMTARTENVPAILFLCVALVVYLLIGGISRYSFDLKTAAFGALNGACLLTFCIAAKLLTALRAETLATKTNNELLQDEYARILQQMESDNDVRLIRHDLKHAIGLLTDGENGDAEGLSTRFAKLMGAVSGGEAGRTGNAVLDALLGYMVAECTARSIRFEVNLNIGSCSFIDDLDACSIFGNAFANALEAVDKLPSDASCERVISFDAAQQQAALVFRLENPSLEHKRIKHGSLTSTKGNDMHGFGLHSIVSHVEKYDGCVLVDTDNAVFTLTILVPLPAGGTSSL